MEEIYVVTETGIEKKKDTYQDGIIREINTKEELEELIERMPYIQTIQAPNGKARRELYQLAMSEFDDLEWVRIIKSVYLRMEEKRYEDFEPEYLEKARKFLYGEIAVRFQISIEEVENFLTKKIEKQLMEF